MCGFDRGRVGGGGAKEQPKLSLLTVTTQRESDVLILINFISIFHIAESMYIIIMKVSLMITLCFGRSQYTIDILICMVVT